MCSFHISSGKMGLWEIQWNILNPMAEEYKEKQKYVYLKQLWKVRWSMVRSVAHQKKIGNRLLSMEIDFLKHSAIKSKLEKLQNKEIRCLMHTDRTAVEEGDILRKQLVCYGHVNRMEVRRLSKVL